MDYHQFFHKFETPVGMLTAVSDGTAITRLSFFTPPEMEFLKREAVRDSEILIFVELGVWLDTYFSGVDPGAAPLMKFGDTAFRQSVWRMVAEVPYGTLITYGEIARRLARQRGIARMAAQAVGGAMAHNSISLLVPCHRVISSDGGLGGYGGCTDLKVKLLEGEGIFRDWNA